VLAGLLVGYILAACLGMVDFSKILDGGIITFPHFLIFTPEFRLGPILSVCVIYLVSATETIGDVSALAAGGLGRNATEQEISGALTADGFASSLSALFGCPPITSFSQNVGLVAMTKVVNRFTIMTGAGILILAGFFPPIARFMSSVPSPIIGGIMIMVLGQILVSGVEMIATAGFTQRNPLIVALSMSIWVGFTTTTEIGIWDNFPTAIQTIFSQNVVAIVFVTAILLNLFLPKEMN
jgi:NCS2 family nucleobase:cation symporter-2